MAAAKHRSDSGHHICACAMDCGTVFKEDDLIDLARAIADHWNREHPDDLAYNYEPLVDEWVGGYHVHGDTYEVTRRREFVTAFDVFATGRRVPISEEFAVPGDEYACIDCWRFVPKESDRVEADGIGIHGERFRCLECAGQQKTERRRQANGSLADFTEDADRRGEAE